MKTLIYMILIVAFSLSSCSSQKKLVDSIPFELGDAICYNWAGGRAESGSGTMLEISLKNGDLDVQKMQQAYFRGKVAHIKVTNTENGWVAKANFEKESSGKADMVMHGDSSKEVGNQPPKIKEKFPFELNDDECVISFLDGDTVKYFKLSNIEQTKQKIHQ